MNGHSWSGENACAACVPSGTFHFAFRCHSLEPIGARRHELFDLDPYRSSFFVDPVNGLQLEYTTRLRDPSTADRDPGHRQFPASLSLFDNASRRGPDHEVGACEQRGDQHGPPGDPLDRLPARHDDNGLLDQQKLNDYYAYRPRSGIH